MATPAHSAYVDIEKKSSKPEVRVEWLPKSTPKEPTTDTHESIEPQPPISRGRERSLSRMVSALPNNPAEHNLDTEWISRRATFIHHLDENEQKLDAELVADMRRWNQEIENSESALNDLAEPKRWPTHLRDHETRRWARESAVRGATMQELRPEQPLPLHRYRRFKHDQDLLAPEDWEEIHRNSTFVGSQLHPLAATGHQRHHDKEELTKEIHVPPERGLKWTVGKHYIANVLLFVPDRRPTPHELENSSLFETHRGKTGGKLNLWPHKPKIYPNYLAPPPDWWTCDRKFIPYYLPSSKLTDKERCDAWARYNKPVKENLTWNPSFIKANNDYFPVVIHVNESRNWIGGYRRKPKTKEQPRPWLSIAMINFLPPHVFTCIAGEKGLVVFDGGEYLTLPHQEFWHAKWPSQSITMVVNPLVAAFQIIPPLDDPKYAQEFKIGTLQVEELPAPSQSYYKLYMVGERSGTFMDGQRQCSYTGSLVTIYDSRSNTLEDVNTYKVRPSPFGVSSLGVVHGQMIWGGINPIGKRERVTHIKSKRYQPADNGLEYENGVVSYDLLCKKFQFLKFHFNEKVGDLGNDDIWESPRILCCYGVPYLVTRQTRSKKEYKMPQKSDSTYYVCPPRVFRLFNLADSIHTHALSTMPTNVRSHLFGPNQLDLAKCQYDVRAGMGEVCFFGHLQMTFVICLPEVDQWRTLELTHNVLPSVPNLLHLADCKYTPNFRANPKCQHNKNHESTNGGEELYPSLSQTCKKKNSSGNISHFGDYSRCCDKDPLSHLQDVGTLGSPPLLSRKPMPMTPHELHVKSMVDIASGHRQSVRQISLASRAHDSVLVVPSGPVSKLSYMAPTLPPNWLENNERQNRGPPHPPTQAVLEHDE